MSKVAGQLDFAGLATVRLCPPGWREGLALLEGHMRGARLVACSQLSPNTPTPESLLTCPYPQVDVWVALITFLYLDFLDATSTMFTMVRAAA